MNQTYAVEMQAGQLIGGQQAKDAYMSRTIGENIDQRIANLKAEIQRLEGVKTQLLSGASLLDVRIEDLRQAMSY